MSFSDSILTISNFLWSWPLIIYMVSASLIATIALHGIQFTYFFTSWKLVLFSSHESSKKTGYISPFQAFLNILNATVGNGSIVGIATATAAGGPGAAVWIFCFGILSMALRYLEVYTSLQFVRTLANGLIRGGPMEFLQKVPGKSFLPMLYAAATLFVAFTAGSAVQCNSIRYGIETLIGPGFEWYSALFIFFFILYGLLGGSQRIIALSDKLVPIKITLFAIMTGTVLLINITALPSALIFIIKSAFTPQAVFGACTGFTLRNALRYGLARSLSVSEVGLGTASILFGTTGAQNPHTTSIMSMASVVVSNVFICCSLILMYVVTGVWNGPAQGIAMTAAAYATVFGTVGTAIASLLSILFGMGVLITYAYIGREVWTFFTHNKYFWLYNFLYCAMAFIGALSRIDVIWNAVDIGNAAMMILTVYGLLWLLPTLTQQNNS